MKTLIKTFMLGICFSLFLTNFSFAKTNDVKLLSVQTTSVENSLTEKQKEIDKYLFEDHVKDLASKGIKVTHTGQTNDAVEIGITPFTQENADYLYGIFGKDKIKIVEGTQAQLMTETAATTAAADSNSETLSNSFLQTYLIYILPIVIILGTAGLLIRTRSIKR